ncbi:MAG: Rid family hydrolase [Planctomycetota bacterium]|nr:Rid family hydrolase [Planctomycetota bacterium]
MKRVNMTNGRERIDTGSPWEQRMGYSRAMRAGPLITVAGCVGISEDGTYPDTLVGQTRCALDRIQGALHALDADLDQIVRIRIYTTCIDRWEEIATVMGPTFADTRPPNVLVEVARLVDADALVEIEADAWTGA